jgi:methionine synthase I (cobalamin-dependent)
VLDELRAGQIVVCDGAMGTMLHAAGVPLDRSLPELNLSQPGLVRDLHAAYLNAGARILQTNTFGANRLRLAGTGLDSGVSEINIAGARLAREVIAGARHPVLLAGSVGPAASAPAVRRVPPGARADILREQIAALCDWVDMLILETFGDLESLVQAIEVAEAESDLPVVAQLTFGDDGRTLRGEDPAEAAAVLSRLGVTAIGANCTVGPAVLVDVVAEMAGATDLPVSVQPNAGVPRRLGNQLRYARNAEYFAEAAPRFVGSGASLLGGCCGTTPAHVRAIARTVAALPAAQRIRAAKGQHANETITITGAPGSGRTAPADEQHGPGWLWRLRRAPRWRPTSNERPRCTPQGRACWSSPNRRRLRRGSTRWAPPWCCTSGSAARYCCRWRQLTATSRRCRRICSARMRSACGWCCAAPEARGWQAPTPARVRRGTSTRSAWSPCSTR